MNDFMIKNLHPLKWNERICFECSGCGSCCRHIRDSVPLESLDAYRLAVYLREKEVSITSMTNFCISMQNPYQYIPAVIFSTPLKLLAPMMLVYS